MGRLAPSAFKALPPPRVFDGVQFPRILAPSAASCDVGSFRGWIRQHKDWIEEQLFVSGAVLFRGFGVDSAADFDAVVREFGYEELPYVGGAAPRTNVVGRVFTSNESPPDQKIPFHHEMAQVPEYPSKLFFYCEVEAKEGGETPIVLSHLIYDKMASKFPEFVKDLEDKGLLYIRVLGEGDDPSSPIGRGWQSTFLTKDKSEAQAKAAKLGMQVEWLDDGCLKTISGPIPAIKNEKSHGRKIWFNSMVAAYTGWEDARNVAERAVVFGDGSPLPRAAVLECLDIIHELSVAIPWCRGDVLLIDNLAVLHARRPFTPPRRVLASLCK
ncbi:hypothetical protein SELMODRAFT_90998 [Selaginella moellendorffii]|uniref:TauD/TfdA-like domain-containing protein n=1 Tax=Selaginella moellendorffii TaxID=88036 RepID=D8RCF9_SELML|nr:clavaminate synthase-like protein At3g21360 [Selaginella moellendorffii]XP_002990619.1 clavaminate synthase-like protein At3g21360 [Selaginella moellendorffii]XP_024520220.1 clavaminate synthase-like protein At3g21360 [Selaginella moellendorffii]XP_024529714.1 clavaminate synthase-like protein At3g21360 [Selaginella moellendorffii]EFJ08251.1 hypothetical protein SELMODRAFT_131940 [Selaginella moellendorffii]EFJ29847.1 hypothetical protein SELMODRAFT_90998 [Selaginella moellendorffii]|eukprot:XP_002968731.1 clavaminate synthase-like protein At3g21360 [Selaginella moellendorffii]